MLTRTKRPPAMKVHLWRTPSRMNARTLEMMVMSGVVRRADLNPPLVPYGRRTQAPENPHGASPQESASEQGWLSRMILGRKTMVPWPADRNR
jgi:hypothetical protein